MTYTHTNLYVVRVVERPGERQQTTWYAGPYGGTAADQTANYLESVANHERECYVEPLHEEDGASLHVVR
jgi:hypothetical protein